MKNKFRLVLAIIFITLQSGHACAEDERAILEQSIGKLILMHDSDHRDRGAPFGDLPAGFEAIILYEKYIKHLSEKSRLEYFWAVIQHFDLIATCEGDPLKVLILRDNAKSFFEALESYIKLESNELQLKKAKLVLYELRTFEKSSLWKELKSKGNYEERYPILKEGYQNPIKPGNDNSSESLPGNAQ